MDARCLHGFPAVWLDEHLASKNLSMPIARSEAAANDGTVLHGSRLQFYRLQFIFVTKAPP